jgi:hypothetical protein
VVGTTVDDEDVVGQLRRDRTRLAVREGEEDDVVPGEGLGGRLDEREVREGAQVGLQGDEGLTGVLERRDGRDLEVGVRSEEPEELTAGVPAGARYCYGVRHVSILMVESVEDRGRRRLARSLAERRP